MPPNKRIIIRGRRRNRNDSFIATKSSSSIAIVSLLIFVAFTVNFVTLYLYFPSPSSSSSLLMLSEHETSLQHNTRMQSPKQSQDQPKEQQQQQQQQRLTSTFKDSRRKSKQQQQQQQQQQNGLGRKKPATTTSNHMKKSKINCPFYGCPIYPPELTNPQLNQTLLRAFLGRSMNNLHAAKNDGAAIALLSSSSLSLPMEDSGMIESEFKLESDFAAGTNSFATLSQKGKSHVYNQDRAVFVSPFLPDAPDPETARTTTAETKSFLAAIFDGHGKLGHDVAQEAVERFPLLLARKLTKALHRTSIEMSNDFTSKYNGKNQNESKNENVLRIEDYDLTDFAIRKALNETFVEVNKNGTPSTFLLGGCTASVTLRWGSKLYLANAGDSQTVVVSSTMASLPQPTAKPPQRPSEARAIKVEYMTRRDKANLPDERARIEGFGGKIHVNSKGFDPRVIVHSEAAKDTIGLAMSRSLGDWEWKAVGVTAEPIIDIFDLSKQLPPDEAENNNKTLSPRKAFFLLAASDGMWDMRPRKEFFANQLAGSFDDGGNFRRQGSNLGSLVENGHNYQHLRPLFHLYNVIQKITPKVQKGYRDDITAILVKL